MSGKEIQMKFDEKYYLKKLKEMLDIDSVTGQCREFQDYLVKEIEALGFKTKTLRKGGVLVELGGKGEGRVISAHADTIGPGTRATHGYERTHIDAIRDTYALTWAYIFD